MFKDVGSRIGFADFHAQVLDFAALDATSASFGVIYLALL
jgi:hypothetical protein